MGLSLQGSHMGKQTVQILGEISEDGVAASRPMLSAVAISVTAWAGRAFSRKRRILEGSTATLQTAKGIGVHQRLKLVRSNQKVGIARGAGQVSHRTYDNVASFEQTNSSYVSDCSRAFLRRTGIAKLVLGIVGAPDDSSARATGRPYDRQDACSQRFRQ